MPYPTIQEVQKLLKTYDQVPVFYEVFSDSCTPIQIFRALQETSDTCFILESVENTQWGRYSFIGTNPCMEVCIKDGTVTKTEHGIQTTEPIQNPVAYLSALMQNRTAPTFAGKPRMTGGFVGYFGYDTIRYAEPTLNHPPKDDLNLPDCHLFLYEQMIAFDHLTNQTILIGNMHKGQDLQKEYDAFLAHSKKLAAFLTDFIPTPSVSPTSASLVIKETTSKEQHLQNIQKIQQYIQDGELFQAVLSRRVEIENPPDSFDVYRRLRTTNPSPYLYYIKTKDYQIAGSSPEMLVNVTNGTIYNRPIAGTTRRGATPQEDEALEQALLADPKERAEHSMLVDLGRNDVGRVSTFGSVEVTSFMRAERYAKVTHLVSDITGKLHPDKTALDALLSVLPAGTLSGAPKIRAMQIIDELEPVRRGIYGGTIGYLGFDGNLDTCIAIRTAVFRNGKAYVQSGGGIVADSVPEREFEETKEKACAVIQAFEEAAVLAQKGAESHAVTH